MRSSALVVAIGLAVAISGCTGASPDSVDPSRSSATESVGSPTETGPGPTAREPGGTPSPTQPGTKIKVDPNASFEGSAHRHDWWAGETEIVVHDKDVPTGPAGVCAGAVLDASCTTAGTTTRNFFRFDRVEDVNARPNIVYPGTGSMRIEVRVGAVLQPFELGYSSPLKPSFANGFKVDAPSKTFVIEGINESMTDPPHFRESGWRFAIATTPGPGGYKTSAYQGPLHVTITVIRDPNREPPVDPPHPDLWGTDTSKILYEGRTTASQYVNLPMLTSGSVAVPDWFENATVLMGTAKMAVTLSWTNEMAGDFRLGWQYCPTNYGCGYIEEETFRPAPTTDSATRRTYELEVRPDMWDSPYVRTSGWQNTVYVQNQAGTDDGAFKGTIDWKFEIFKGQ